MGRRGPDSMVLIDDPFHCRESEIKHQATQEATTIKGWRE